MRATKSVVLAAAALLLAAPAIAQETAKAELMIKSSEWTAAFNRGDAEAIGRLYAEDAVLMAPGSEPAVGRDAIAGAMQAFIDTGVKLDL